MEAGNARICLQTMHIEPEPGELRADGAQECQLYRYAYRRVNQESTEDDNELDNYVSFTAL